MYVVTKINFSQTYQTKNLEPKTDFDAVTFVLRHNDTYYIA